MVGLCGAFDEVSDGLTVLMEWWDSSGFLDIILSTIDIFSSL